MMIPPYRTVAEPISTARGECGALSYERDEHELRATLRPRRALGWLPILAVGAAVTVVGFILQPTDSVGFLIIPLVLFGC